MSSKQTLLIVVDWFAPGYKAGGPIRSSLNVAMAMKDRYQVRVLTTDTDHGETTPYKDVAGNEWNYSIDPEIAVFYARKRSLRLGQLKEQIINSQPDFIYLNHIWSPYFVLYPLWLKWSGKIKSKIILCPRGGLYDSALSVKQYKKTPLLKLMRLMKIDRHVLFHATNEREKIAIRRFFANSRVIVADNLPSAIQPQFVPCSKENGELKCVFIARIVAIKNLLFLIEALKKVNSAITLTVVGPIEDTAYWAECLQKIELLPANISVYYVGPKENAELMGIIQNHHLFVLPTTGENFGHSIFEALLAGRPVLISDQTPWLQLKEKGIGWDLPLNDPSRFSSAIEEVAKMEQVQYNELAIKAWKYAADYISNPAVKQDYYKLFS